MAMMSDVVGVQGSEHTVRVPGYIRQASSDLATICVV